MSRAIRAVSPNVAFGTSIVQVNYNLQGFMDAIPPPPGELPDNVQIISDSFNKPSMAIAAIDFENNPQFDLSTIGIKPTFQYQSPDDEII